MTIGFVVAAAVKIFRLPLEIEYFRQCALPAWTMNAVGIAELILAAMFVWQRTRRHAAVVTLFLMGGACASIVKSGWYVLLPLPVMTSVAAIILLADRESIIRS